MASSKDSVSNPNKSLVVPQWLNEDYFQKVVEKDEPDFEKILEFVPVAAIPPGENFTSSIFRVHLKLQMKDGSTKSKSYIFKTVLEGEGGQALKLFGLFPKEVQMYKNFLPAFEELYENAGLKVQLSPKCLLVDVEGDRINIVFEDLKTQNFVNADRTKGLDLPHMKEVLKKIAEYHAASAVYAEKNGPYSEEFKNGFVCLEAKEFLKGSYEAKKKSHIRAMKEWCKTEEEKSFIENLANADQYWEAAARTLKPIESDFNCLTHGDFWGSNIMFNYKNDQTINRAILVDFQLCKWGSPAEDLHFVIVVSAAKDIRFKEFDNFIQIYHQHLVKNLKILGYQKPLPKLRDLQMAMFKENVTFYPYFGLINHLATVLWPVDEKSNFANLSKDDDEGDYLRYMQNINPKFVESARDVLSFYFKKGIFDFSDFK